MSTFIPIDMSEYIGMSYQLSIELSTISMAMFNSYVKLPEGINPIITANIS